MKFPMLVPWYYILKGKKVVVRSTTRLGVLYVQFPVVDTPIKCEAPSTTRLGVLYVQFPVVDTPIKCEAPTSYKLIVCVRA